MTVITLPVCAAREIFNMFFLMGVWGDFHIKGALLGYILPSYVYTVALAPAIYLLVKLTAGRINYNNL